MKHRFPVRMQCWMSEQLADTCEAVADHQATTASAVIRQALQFYFLQIGALTPVSPQPAQLNGQHHEETGYGL